jgi:flavodoxin
MKTLVIYYSYEGNSALAAEEIKKAAGADILEIKTEDDTRRTGLAKYIWGGKQAFSHQFPKLKPYTVNPGEYELIIIGGPVWAGAPAPALQSFLGETKITGKRIALFVTHAGGKGKALDKFKALLPGNSFAGEIDFINPAKQDRAGVSKKVEEWIKTIQA